jgi:P-type conjugative transfer protein TrbJ
MVGAEQSDIRSGGRADDDRAGAAASIECATNRDSAIHARRSARPAAGRQRKHVGLGFALADVQCFETEALLGQSNVVAPVLTYLFHRLEERFDGRPTLLVLDEAWIFLDHPLFAARIREWLKTLREKNVAVLFATQSLADISASSIAPAIIESCPQRILLPNDRAVEPQSRQAYERFGLNDRQIELISRATPKQHYYLQSARGNRLFELGIGPIALALCGASDPASQKRIDAVLAEHGLDDFVARFLESADLGWAADLLADFPAPNPPAPRKEKPMTGVLPLKKHLFAGALGLGAACAIALGTIVPSEPAHAFVVFDPSNYSQNILTAARTLQQINNQITMLQNQAQSLINQAKNLTTIGFPELAAITQTIQQIDKLMAQAQQIQFRVATLDQQFKSMFPTSFNQLLTNNQHAVDARARLDTSMAAYKQTMTVQAQVVENIAADETTLTGIVARSQGAQGALQAQQATNQLLALVAKQQFQLQNLMAAQFRADAIEQANRTQQQTDAQSATTKFLGSGNAYTP